jgi:hypothetical protein
MRPEGTPLASAVFALSAVLCASAGSAEEPATKPVPPQDKEADTKKLAQASQNPIANLINVPFQFNFGGGIGPYERTQFVLNLQPVIPIRLKGPWILVSRLILPFVAQPDASAPKGATWGVGDFNPQIYVVVELKHGFTLGVGPTLVLPTATDMVLGSGKLSLGPSAVAVWIGGPVVAGLLVNNAWSVAGDHSRASVNTFFLQPFININLPHHTFLVTSPQIVADWTNSAWTVPVGGGVGAILKLGLPANVNLQAYWNALAPTNSPSWVVRLQIAFLFPTAPK